MRGRRRTLLIHLRRDIPRRPTHLYNSMELVLLHNPAQSEICYHDLRVVGGTVEQEVLGFEIFVTMNKSGECEWVQCEWECGWVQCEWVRDEERKRGMGTYLDG